MQQPKPLFNTRKAMNNNRKNKGKKKKKKNTDRIHFFPEVILLQSSWGLTVLQENLSTCEKQNKAEHRSLTN